MRARDVHDDSETDALVEGLLACDIDTDSDACIFYTSGTTGLPKAAVM